MSIYLGIDLGTSATKTVLTDAAGRVLARGRATHRKTPAGGRVDTGSWADSVREACLDLGGAAARATAVGLAVHCPVAVLMDRDGTATAPGLCWDHDALPALMERYNEVRANGLAERVGNVAHPSTSMGLAWRFFAEHEPDSARRASTLGFVGTWLGRLLTGRDALDPTQASYSGLFGTTDREGDWLDAMLDGTGVPRAALPPIRPSLSELGPLLPGPAEALGLRAGIPVVVGAADTAAAAYLIGLDEGRGPLYTVGTTHVITRSTAVPDPAPRALQRADVRPGRWLWHAATNGGIALAAAARLLGHGDAVEKMIDLAGAATPRQAAAAPVFVPHTTPERAPFWFDRPRTALVGHLPDTDPCSAAWGCVEGVAFAARLMLSMTEPDGAGGPGSAGGGRLFLAGSFGAEAAYARMVADLFGREVDLINESCLPAMGAAAIAARTVDGVPPAPPPSVRLVPRPDRAPLARSRWNTFTEVWSRITK
ncbi:FGGY-family carbohydrate kinase [Actinomadura vinacea]|uniref:FGGY-family carbohydrate kinase n=1 Tax=Actinomadura vinacea TaxID=115336 RepID=A0ABN3IH48_9ACTN